MKLKTYFITTVLFLFCSTAFGNANYTQQAKAAAEQKADYLLLFAKYADWDNETETNRLIIGILGDSPVEGYLQKMVQAKMIRNKAVIVQRFDSIEEVLNPSKNIPGQFCHILFMPDNSLEVSSSNLASLAKKNIMVIGEKDGFIAQGGFINLVMQTRSQLKFEVNHHAMKYGFKLSPQILRLAILVDPSAAPVKADPLVQNNDGTQP